MTDLYSFREPRWQVYLRNTIKVCVSLFFIVCVILMCYIQHNKQSVQDIYFRHPELRSKILKICFTDDLEIGHNDAQAVYKLLDSINSETQSYESTN